MPNLGPRFAPLEVKSITKSLAQSIIRTTIVSTTATTKVALTNDRRRRKKRNSSETLHISHAHHKSSYQPIDSIQSKVNYSICWLFLCFCVSVRVRVRVHVLSIHKVKRRKETNAKIVHIIAQAGTKKEIYCGQS